MKKNTKFEIFNPIKLNLFVTSKCQITLQYIKRSKTKKMKQKNWKFQNVYYHKGLKIQPTYKLSYL